AIFFSKTMRKRAERERKKARAGKRKYRRLVPHESLALLALSSWQLALGNGLAPKAKSQQLRAARLPPPQFVEHRFFHRRARRFGARPQFELPNALAQKHGPAFNGLAAALGRQI